jgi:predicted dehydrogenase
MLRVGIVGFGFMGRMHYKCWKNQPEVQIVAICDTNPNLVEDTRKVVGNIAGAADAVDFESLNVYTEYSKMLRKEKPDVVSISLPTHLHAAFAVKALKAGVNVLCEKPMSLDLAGCKKMIAAAEKSGKLLQIGHCVRFWPEYAKAKQIVASGEYGKVLAASFRRLSSAPTWSRDGWLNDSQLSGGMILDLHIHDTDFVQYLLGTPTAVESVCGKAPNSADVHVVTQYFYDDGKAIVAEGGWAMMPSFGFEMSFNIMLEKATLVYDCTRTPAFRVCPGEGTAFVPQVESGDGYSRQIDHFVRAVQGKSVEPVLSLAESMESVRIVAAEIKSARSGKRIRL